jgi:hypothetical protein
MVEAYAAANMMDRGDVIAVYLQAVMDLSGPVLSVVMHDFFGYDLTRQTWRSRIVRLLNLQNVFINPMLRFRPTNTLAGDERIANIFLRKSDLGNPWHA